MAVEQYEEVYSKINENYVELVKYFLYCRNFIAQKEENDTHYRENYSWLYKTQWYSDLQSLYFKSRTKLYDSFCYKYKMEVLIKDNHETMIKLIKYTHQTYALFEGDIVDEFSMMSLE